MQDIAEDILRQAAEGDLRSFEEIYKAAAGFVYNVALRIVGNKEDAEEAAQDVFLTLYRKLSTFRFESSFKTWVYRITVNRAINLAKSRPKAKMVEYEELPDTRQEKGEITREIDKAAQGEAIKELLSALQPEQRACLVLRDMEGLSYRQIAAALSVNINTVRSRLNRARERMLTLRKKVPYEYL
jgi:RNA polymerase sigma-70 factor, ECF subfamily